MAALVAAFVVLLGGMAAGGYQVIDRTSGDEDSSDGPDEGKVSVFFCLLTSQTPKCGRRVASGAEKEQVKRQLQSMPGVRTIVYESQLQAWENFRKRFADNKEFVAKTLPGDIPDSYRVQAEDAATARAVKAAMDDAPGVDIVVLGPIPPRT